MDKFIRVAIELIVYITFCFATVRWKVRCPNEPLSRIRLCATAWDKQSLPGCTFTGPDWIW